MSLPTNVSSHLILEFTRWTLLKNSEIVYVYRVSTQHYTILNSFLTNIVERVRGRGSWTIEGGDLVNPSRTLTHGLHAVLTSEGPVTPKFIFPLHQFDGFLFCPVSYPSRIRSLDPSISSPPPWTPIQLSWPWF